MLQHIITYVALYSKDVKNSYSISLFCQYDLFIIDCVDHVCGYHVVWYHTVTYTSEKLNLPDGNTTTRCGEIKVLLGKSCHSAAILATPLGSYFW